MQKLQLRLESTFTEKYGQTKPCDIFPYQFVMFSRKKYYTWLVAFSSVIVHGRLKIFDHVSGKNNIYFLRCRVSLFISFLCRYREIVFEILRTHRTLLFPKGTYSSLRFPRQSYCKYFFHRVKLRTPSTP